MKNIIRTNDAATPASFGNVVDHLFQKNLSRFFDDSFWGSEAMPANKTVPVNIRETDKSFELEMVAPGLNKEDIRIENADNLLTISYNHNEQHESNQEGVVRSEFRRQSFNRSFTLNERIDAGNISAKYEAGILKLTLPKKEDLQKQARTIDVQ